MRNTIENIIIALVVFIFGSATGGYIGYKAAKESANSVIELQSETFKQAIEKNTTEVNNTISNEFKKVKNKKGEPINIIIDNATKSVITSDTNQMVTVEKKRGFFKRILNRNKNN